MSGRVFEDLAFLSPHNTLEGVVMPLQSVVTVSLDGDRPDPQLSPDRVDGPSTQAASDHHVALAAGEMAQSVPELP